MLQFKRNYTFFFYVFADCNECFQELMEEARCVSVSSKGPQVKVAPDPSYPHLRRDGYSVAKFISSVPRLWYAALILMACCLDFGVVEDLSKSGNRTGYFALSFFIAQFASSMVFGKLSDIIGTFLLFLCHFCIFNFTINCISP